MTRTAAALASLFALCLTATAHAAPSKEECVEAHGKGQDLREKGKLVEAKKNFLQCAQAACPALVQADCARFGEELRTLPSLSFAAHDGDGKDLTGTKVYLDGELVTENLDDGKSYDVDPGKHQIKFVNRGVERLESVVVNQSDRGRTVVATFGEPTRSTSSGVSMSPPAEPEQPHRSVVPLVVAGVGGAALITGIVLVVVGKGNVPSQCSLGDHDCAAPPQDPVFADAKSAVGLMNVGFVVGGIGAGVAVGGVVWYALSPKKTSTTTAFTPWFDGRTGGLSLSRHF